MDFVCAANGGETYILDVSYDFIVLLELLSNLSRISMKILSRSLDASTALHKSLEHLMFTTGNSKSELY